MIAMTHNHRMPAPHASESRGAEWSVIKGTELSPTQVAAWHDLLSEAPEFESPYFTPEYVQTVASILPSIEVGWLTCGDQVQAIFPYERVSRYQAIPVGRDLCDYQGIVYRDSSSIEPLCMLRALGLHRWEFDHLFPLEGPLADWCWIDWDSPQVDFSADHAAYWSLFQIEHKKLKHSVGRKARKLEKEHGSLEHQTEVTDRSLLEQLLEWKSQQYEAGGRSHVLREPWVKQFLLKSLDSHSPSYRGRMSALFVGERPIAIEYSLQSKVVSHMLLCAYDPAYARYSPGLMRNLFLLESGLPPGLEKIDFGKGLEEYKRDIMNASARLGEGSVDVLRLRGMMRSSMQKSRYWFLRSNLSRPARYFARMTASRFPFIRRLLAMR